MIPGATARSPVRFHDERRRSRRSSRLRGSGRCRVLAVGDRPAVAGRARRRGAALPGNPRGRRGRQPQQEIDASAVRGRRARRCPGSIELSAGADVTGLAASLAIPCVVKPLGLSGSRGVIRADTPAAARGRRRAGARAAGAPRRARAAQRARDDALLVEGFIEGREYAVEGMLTDGALRVLAIFDKPDPLDGPFFEETIYVTPAPRRRGRARDPRDAAARHRRTRPRARPRPRGVPGRRRRRVVMLEVAARPIGGLCSKVLRFEAPGGDDHGAARRAAAAARRGRRRLGVRARDAGGRRDDDSDPDAGYLQRRHRRRRALAVPAWKMCGSPRSWISCSSRCRRGTAISGSSSRARRRGGRWSAALRAAHERLTFQIAASVSFRRRANATDDSGLMIRSVLFALLRDVAGWRAAPSPKKKSSMCFLHEFLCLLLPGHQPILVEDHLHSLFPHLPGVDGDVLVDALAELAGPGRGVEAGQLFLELLTEDLRPLVFRPGCRLGGRRRVAMTSHLTRRGHPASRGVANCSSYADGSDAFPLSRQNPAL